MAIFPPVGHQLALAALIVVAWAMGGGGIAAALANLSVQVAACVVIAANLPTIICFWRTSPRSLQILVALTLLFPLVQLVPLPPAIWQGLAGRELVGESLALAGDSHTWRAFSIDPHRTLLAATGLIAPLATLFLAWRLQEDGRAGFLWLIVLLGLAALLLGALQLASANEAMMIQVEARGTGDLQATFANRNTSGLFFVVALASLVALPAAKAKVLDHPAIRFAIGGLLTVGVLLSHSRSSIALAVVPLAIAAWRFANRSHAGWKRGRAGLFAALGVAVLAVGLVGMAASDNNRLHDAVRRFAQTDDARLYIWPDALVTVQRFWPAGGGMGTFDDAFQVDESLETLQPLRAGRAHNDYLELAYEGGLAGLLLLCGWLSWLVVATIRIARRGPARAAFVGPLVLWLVAAQSLVDYPLRNQTLLCIAALMIAWTASADRRFAPRRGGGTAAAAGITNVREMRAGE